MSSNEEIVDIINRIDLLVFQHISNLEGKFKETIDRVNEFKRGFQKKIDELYTPNSNTEKTPGRPKNKKKISSQKRNAKIENDARVSVSSNEVSSISTSCIVNSGKPKREASKMASLMINKQALTNNKYKMRRPTDVDEKVVKNVEIKEESGTAGHVVTNENMPPPPTASKRGRKKKIKNEVESSDTVGDCSRVTRSSRIAINQETNKSVVCAEVVNNDRTSHRKRKGNKKVDSDVIIQETPVISITVHDTDTDEDVVKHKNLENIVPNIETETEKVAEKSPQIESVKQNGCVTENKSKEAGARQKHGRTWSSEEEDTKQTAKRPKKAGRPKRVPMVENVKENIPLIPVENIKLEKSLYEDALSETKQSVTFIRSPKPTDRTITIHPAKAPAQLNETVTISKSNVVNTKVLKETIMNETVTIEKSKISNNDAELLLKNGAMNCTVILHKTVNSPVVNNNTHEILEKIHSLQECMVVLKKLPEDEKITLNEKNSQNVADATVVLSPKENAPHWQPPPPQPVSPRDDSLITDDDSAFENSPQKLEKKIAVIKKTPVPVSQEKTNELIALKIPKPSDKKAKKAIKTKPMFSPYANSPVKKRVAAFEKLGDGIPSSTTTMRVTRTKTRNLIVEKENSDKPVSKITPPNFKYDKSKHTTPLDSLKFKSLIPSTDGRQYCPPTSNQTTSKVHNSLVSSHCTASSVSVSSESFLKPGNPLKLTRAELQERREEDQKKRLEKEDEAKRKKDALMQAKIDEQKRIREEKQMRAQKAREERERLKEEKLRQYLAEKEEKQREEAVRKKAWLVKKAAELEEQRKIVEQNRIAKQIEFEEEQKRLMIKKKQEEKAKRDGKPPPLPTVDNADSDSDDDTQRPRVAGPSWGERCNLYPKLMAQRHIPEHLIQKLFNVKPTTPDLQEIFETIDQRLLKRNSSAVWRTPPRYSLLPKY